MGTHYYQRLRQLVSEAAELAIATATATASNSMNILS